MSSRRPKMSTRRANMSSRRANVSSGRPREAFGSEFVRISEAFPSHAMRPRRPQLQAPGAAAQRLRKGISDRTGLLSRSSGGSRHSRLAAVRCLVAPALAFLLAHSALALLAMLARSLVSRASRSMIARFLFLGCFSNLAIFGKIARRAGESSKIEVQKWLRKCFENRAPVREASGRASGSDLGAILDLPRRLRERPGSARRAPGAPQ